VEDGVMSKPESATLEPGDRAPLFTLPNQKGVPVSLESALAGGPVLLGFHRGTW
jgi:peroxiredoxin